MNETMYTADGENDRCDSFNLTTQKQMGQQVSRDGLSADVPLKQKGQCTRLHVKFQGKSNDHMYT